MEQTAARGMEQTAATGHVIGATYHNHYWNQDYTVEAIATVFAYAPGDGVRVRWADGRVSVHCTRLDYRDTRLS